MTLTSVRRQRLQVWSNGQPVGAWLVDAGGAHVLEYAREWLDLAEAHPLSLSLPLLPPGEAHRGNVVHAYFENLLPENDAVRRRIRDRHRARSLSAFDLLASVGRDCAGSLQLLPDDEVPADLHAIHGEALDEAGVAERLRRVRHGTPVGATAHDELRLSIAGAHEKTALLWHDDRWHDPRGSTPSTHIFKLPLGRVGSVDADLSDSIENEWLCAEILRRFGLTMAAARIASFEDEKALVVERFDRQLVPDGRWWRRLPQEDTCQATGTPPDRKYESHGGPGIRRIMRLLERSTEAETDRTDFFKGQVLFWLLAATDGHAKNFSIFIEPGGRFRLTPLYDVLSRRPVMGRGPRLVDQHDASLAMAVTGAKRHYRLVEIQRRHWNETAAACRLGGGAEPLIREILDMAPDVVSRIENALPVGFPERVAAPILRGLSDAVRKLEAMPSS